jgi:hypothetical protein
MMRVKNLFLSLSFLAAAGCAAGPGSGDGSDAERRPLGKADHIGSCEAGDADFCGGKSDGNCWCDDLCATYGDCCADVGDVCGADVPDLDLCMGDAHCDDGQICDHSECLSNCPAGMICPAVCWGQCMQDDGGDEAGSCEGACGGQSGAGCWCDDQCESFGDCCDDKAEACAPAEGCGDGTVALCEIVPPTCPDGLVVSVVDHCFGPCVDPVTCEEPEDTCGPIVADFEAETSSIRSCEDASECGQVLTGTSCGCTRNWVARTDADTSDWTEIREKAFANGCNLPGTISTCDCPAADGFACVNNTCTWNYQ